MDSQKLQEITGRKIPTQITHAAFNLISESLRLGEFIEYVHSLGLFALKNIDAYRKDYYDEAKNSPIRQHIIKVQGEVAFTKNILFSYHEEFVCEMILQRTADNFVKYLSELLAMIFVTKPQSLRSGEQESLDFVLNFASMEELVQALAEKRVEKLAYLGMKDLAEYFGKKLGFELFPTLEQRKETELLIELRNIIVHNRGRVSKTFKQRIADYPKEEGERIDLKYSDIRNVRVLVENLALNIDGRAISKWGLPARSVG